MSAPLRRASLAAMRNMRSRGGGPPGGFFGEGTQTGPNGILYGESPLPAGQARKMESWELPWYLGYGVTTLILTIGVAAKPETSLHAWAANEVKARGV